MNVEKLSRDIWSHHVEMNSCVCRICGCEKNRNFEDHESCVCGTGSTIDNSLGMKRPINSFRAGGHAAKKSRLLESGIRKLEVNFESQPNNSDKIKSMTQPSDVEARGGNSGKSEGAVHTRRFNDSPAVVPIKKRRIQLLEVMRSPSPPPRSPSPQTPPSSTSPCPQTSATSGQTPSSVASSPPLLRFLSVVSPRSAVPLPMSAKKPEVLLPPASHSQPLACVGGILNSVGVHPSESDDGEVLETKEQSLSNAPLVGQVVDKSFNRENEQEPTTIEERLNIEHDLSIKGVLEDGFEAATRLNLHDAVIDTNLSSDKLEGELFRSESGSFSRDDRLHWDLNTDMAAWDASTEQGTGKVIDDDEEGAESPCKSPSAETSQDDRNMVCDEIGRDQVEEEPEIGEEPEVQNGLVEEEPNLRGDAVEDDPEVDEQVVEDAGVEEQIIDEEPEIMEQDTKHREFDSAEKEEVTPLSMQVDIAWNAQDASDFPQSGKPGPWDADLPSNGRDAHEPAEIHSHHDDIPERPLSKFGKQAKSWSDDAEGWTYASEEPELEEHVDYGDSDCRDADDVGLDVDDRTSLMQEESNWKGEDGICHNGTLKLDASAVSETLVKASSDDGRPLEPSLERHTASGRSRTSGWDQLPEGFDNAEEALRAAKEVSARRGGRGGSWSSPVGRGSSINSHTASRFGPGPGPGPGHARGTSRDGFSTARGESYFGDRHPDEFMYERDGFRHGRRTDDNYSAHNTVRGRDSGRRPGLFGRGRAGGWIDSQSGHMNQWGPGRHRPSAGFGGPGNAAAVAAARVENSGFIVGPDGTLTKPGGGMGPGRGGIRSTASGRGGRGGHIQVGRGPHVDMEGGVHYPLRASVGDRVPGMNAGGRGFGMGSGPGYAGGMHDRGGRGSIDRYRGGGMESRRSESPRRPHPLDHPNMMGRMPGMRPDSRVVRSRTPPANHRSVGPTEFTAARSQRSPPPPSSRWSSEKREADSYQDREFKRPLSRSRVPPQRTSPHVVHGSSLTDERDRQVLAGSRQSPPVKGSSINSVHLRKSRDNSLESRPSKRNEDNDVRHTGSFLKDGEYRRSSPTRESDRDREKGSLYRRDRERDDDRRRDSRRSPSRDGRFTGGLKHASTREADDDIAPRRRRPS